MAPEGWRDLPLSELVTVVGGGTPSRSQPAYWNGDVPWATPTDVTGLKGRIISETNSTITDEGLANSSSVLLPPRSLLMTTRATIGACAVNQVSMATNQGFQSLVPKEGARVEFLYYLIQHHKRRLERLAAGSTFLEVSKRTIRDFRVVVPPLPEQRKIAAILSSVDDVIEKTQSVIDQVQVVKRGLMQELLTRGLPGRHTRFNKTEMGEIPEGWIIKTVAEVGKVVTGSTPNTSNQVFWNGTIPFVTPADLGGTKVRITGRSVSEEGLAQVREIPSGTVMVTCIGSIGKLGIAVERCCTNQQINSIIPGNSILSEYLHYALSLTSRTLVGLAGVTAVPIVSKSRFLTLRILVPSLAEQEQIARVLSGADYLIEVNQARLAALTEVKQALMPILLTGELRVTPDPDAA